MKQLLSAVIAVLFAAVTFSAVAQGAAPATDTPKVEKKVKKAKKAKAAKKAKTRKDAKASDTAAAPQ